jgi:hypothetical protein
MFSFLRRTSLYILAIPALVFGLGLLSNQAVLVANHDKFPVMYNDYKVNEYRLGLQHELAICRVATAPDPDADDTKDSTPTVDPCEPIEFRIEALKFGYLDEVHVVMTSRTHLNLLADWIDLGAIYSIGDALLELGEWGFGFIFPLFVFDTVRKLNKHEVECKRVHVVIVK